MGLFSSENSWILDLILKIIIAGIASWIAFRQFQTAQKNLSNQYAINLRTWIEAMLNVYARFHVVLFKMERQSHHFNQKELLQDLNQLLAETESLHHKGRVLFSNDVYSIYKNSQTKAFNSSDLMNQVRSLVGYLEDVAKTDGLKGKDIDDMIKKLQEWRETFVHTLQEGDTNQQKPKLK